MVSQILYIFGCLGKFTFDRSHKLKKMKIHLQDMGKALLVIKRDETLFLLYWELAMNIYTKD